MGRILKIFFVLALSVSAAACSTADKSAGTSELIKKSENLPTQPEETAVTVILTGGTETADERTEENIMYIKVGESVLTAELADNSSAEALKKMLAEGDVTVEMSDYGNFEKVGSLGKTLPRNDEQITTEAGDIILYQGDKITIYYDTNSWSFTRLGKINGVPQKELKSILGSGDVTVTLSLTK